MDKAVIENALNTIWGIAQLLEYIETPYAQQLRDAVVAIKKETLEDPLPDAP